MPRAKLGQHWLQDRRVCAKIARAVRLEKDESCIEIGGGKGALTREIAGRCKRLIVYEIDSRWAGHLRKRAPGWAEGIEVRELDALKIEWSREALGLSAGEPLVITGNLPYYLTSPLLLRLAYSGLDFRRAVFLIQKEVAERIAAKPGESVYGRLTVSLGAFVVPKALFDVPPEAFRPKPKVSGTPIRLTRRPDPLVGPDMVDAFERTVQAAFHMRRKTLKNNLLEGYPALSGDEIEKILERHGIKPNARAQEIGIEEFVNLTRALGST